MKNRFSFLITLATSIFTVQKVGIAQSAQRKSVLSWPKLMNKSFHKSDSLFKYSYCLEIFQMSLKTMSAFFVNKKSERYLFRLKFADKLNGRGTTSVGIILSDIHSIGE